MIVFKVKTVYGLKLLSEETILIRKLKKDIDKNKDREIVPRLETFEFVPVHCKLVNNNYQQSSKTLFTFVPDKKFAQLISITPHSQTMLIRLSDARVASIAK